MDNTIALAISAPYSLLCVVVGGGFCLSISRVSAVASRSRFCGDCVAMLFSAVDIARVVRYPAAFLLCASASCVSWFLPLLAWSRLARCALRIVSCMRLFCCLMLARY